MFGVENQLYSHVLTCNLVTSLCKNIIWQDSRNTSVKAEELVNVHLVPMKVDKETPNGKTKKTPKTAHLGLTGERKKKKKSSLTFLVVLISPWYSGEPAPKQPLHCMLIMSAGQISHRSSKAGISVEKKGAQKAPYEAKWHLGTSYFSLKHDKKHCKNWPC